MPFKVHNPGAAENYFNTVPFVIWKAFMERDNDDIQGYMMIALPANEATYSAKSAWSSIPASS